MREYFVGKKMDINKELGKDQKDEQKIVTIKNLQLSTTYGLNG